VTQPASVGFSDPRLLAALLASTRGETDPTMGMKSHAPAGLLSGPSIGGGLFGAENPEANKAAMSALAASLLANSGPQPYRTTMGQHIGMGLQAGHAAKADALERDSKQQFMKAQIQAMLTRAQNDGTSGVQSTVIGEDGFYYTVDRITGTMTNTGVKAAPNMRIVEQEGNVPFGVVTGRGQAGRVVDLGGAAPAAPGGAPFMPSAASPTVGPIRNPTAGDRARDIASAQAGVELATRPDITRATELAKTEAERTAALPGQLADIQKMRENIEGLVNSKGFSRIYGKSRYTGGTFPGTAGADSEARRLQLDAQAFSEAIQKMRGLGALSNAEGSKVSAAYTRATNVDQTEEAAAEAWAEVLDNLRLAEERLRMGVRVNETAAGGNAPAQAIDHLRRNPQLKEAFRQKYGYVPDGI
jgi:hypothetical protein